MIRPTDISPKFWKKGNTGGKDKKTNVQVKTDYEMGLARQKIRFGYGARAF